MDWIIAGITGLFIGGFFGVFGMAILSGRAYDKGLKDAFRGDYHEGVEEGYRMALHDLTVAERISDEVVFTSKTDNEGD